MGKHFRLLVDMAYDGEGDVIRALYEDDTAIYYYDGADRYCYLEKSTEGVEWEYCEVAPVLFMKYGGMTYEYSAEEVNSAIRELTKWIGDIIDFETTKVTITVVEE